MTDLSQLKTRYLKARDAYYNAKPVMTDAQFDSLEDRIRAADPNWSELKKTGAKIKHKKAKVKLDHFMPSLNKLYPHQADKWLQGKDQVLIMDKLDGNALQFKVHKGNTVRLVTRGDGETGGDISFLIPYLNLPQGLGAKYNFVARAEAVMKESTFEKIYAKKYDNARNLMAGILNRTMTGKPTAEEREALSQADIVVLGIYGQNLYGGLTDAKDLGIKVVNHAYLKNATPENLAKALVARKKASHYAMDGLVLAKRGFKLDYESNDRPKDLIAFKVNSDDATVEAEVLEIIWQLSAHGRITPKVKLKPIRLGGVTIQHATVHNAQWMMDRKIGPGAKVSLVRSGDVIPKIVGVLKPGKFQPPDILYKQVGVNFVASKATASSATGERITVLQIAKFMTKMKIEGLKSVTIQKLIRSLPNVDAYIDAWSKKQLARRLMRAGIGPKVSAKIEAEFDSKLKGKVNLKQLMVASHVFDAGIGEKKLSMIEDYGLSMDDLMEMFEEKDVNPHWIVAELCNVHGYSGRSANLTVQGLQKFVPLYKKYRSIMNIDGSLPKKASIKGGPLSGQVVSWTSYRDKSEEAAVEAAGGTVASLGSKTTILLWKEGAKFMDKIEKARAKGIRVCHFHELKGIKK